jgi:hypothetical protein
MMGLSIPRGAFLALAVAVPVLTGSGCGETVIDDAKTEDAIEQNLTSALGKEVQEVDCPSDVEVKAKETFECSVTLAGGKDETVRLRIINEDADVAIVGLQPGE